MTVPMLPKDAKPKDYPAIVTRLGCYDHPIRELTLRRSIIRRRTVILQARALISLRDVVYPDMKAQNIPLTVVSSYRSCALQCQIAKEHGCSCITGCPGIVAGMGRSYHNIGLAADLYPPPPSLVNKYRATMSRHGWNNFSGPGGSDPNHWTWHEVG